MDILTISEALDKYGGWAVAALFFLLSILLLKLYASAQDKSSDLTKELVKANTEMTSTFRAVKEYLEDAGDSMSGAKVSITKIETKLDGAYTLISKINDTVIAINAKGKQDA